MHEILHSDITCVVKFMISISTHTVNANIMGILYYRRGGNHNPGGEEQQLVVTHSILDGGKGTAWAEPVPTCETNQPCAQGWF